MTSIDQTSFRRLAGRFRGRQLQSRDLQRVRRVTRLPAGSGDPGPTHGADTGQRPCRSEAERQFCGKSSWQSSNNVRRGVQGLIQFLAPMENQLRSDRQCHLLGRDMPIVDLGERASCDARAAPLPQPRCCRSHRRVSISPGSRPRIRDQSNPNLARYFRRSASLVVPFFVRETANNCLPASDKLRLSWHTRRTSPS